MIVAVIGGRRFFDRAWLYHKLDELNSRTPITMVVSGGARGADSFAYAYAIERGITFVCHPPLRAEVEEMGFARAAKRRNLRIVEHADFIAAFPDPQSVGTYHAVSLAKKLGKSGAVYRRVSDASKSVC